MTAGFAARSLQLCWPQFCVEGRETNHTPPQEGPKDRARLQEASPEGEGPAGSLSPPYESGHGRSTIEARFPTEQAAYK